MITIKKTLADDKAPRKSNATGEVNNEKKPFYMNKGVLIAGGIVAAGLVYFLFIRGKGNKLEDVTPTTD